MSGRFDPRLWGPFDDALDDLFGPPADLPANLDDMLIASGRPGAPPVLIGGRGAGDVGRGFGADPTPLQPYPRWGDLLSRPTDPRPTLDDLVIRAGDPTAPPVLVGAPKTTQAQNFAAASVGPADPDIVLAPPIQSLADPDIAPPAGITGQPTIKPEDMGPGQDRGEAFDTPDEAARAIYGIINPWSVAENQEYGWLIYQGSDGKYRYTRPRPGGKVGSDKFALGPDPGGTDSMGHTHAAYSDADGRVSSRSQDTHKSDEFSDPDYDYMRRNPRKFKSFYLGTPSGHLYVWRPRGGQKEVP